MKFHNFHCSYFRLRAGEVCAGGEAGKDACDGDGGSPLVCQSEEGNWHVVGLVAWGVGCAEHATPGIYVNVDYYLDFILSKSYRRKSVSGKSSLGVRSGAESGGEIGDFFHPQLRVPKRSNGQWNI